MERNIRTFGALLACLVMVASVLIVPNVSADTSDLHVEATGEFGVTSWGSPNGTASFVATITSLSAAKHDGVTVTVDFTEEWNAETVNISAYSGSVCDTATEEPIMKVIGDLAAGASETIQACITVNLDSTFADVGDQRTLTISVTSDDESVAATTEVFILVSYWKAFSTTGTQAYNVGDTKQYTLSVQNLHVDSSGTPLAWTGEMSITFTDTTGGWGVSDGAGDWDEFSKSVKIYSLSADQTIDLILDINLREGAIPASSYTGHDETLGFSTADATNTQIQRIILLTATIADKNRILVQGDGGRNVDNGCHTKDATGAYSVAPSAAAVNWTVDVTNMGNTKDTMSYTFDLAGVATGWSLTGADAGSTIELEPNGFGTAGAASYESLTLELTIPAGLAAGSNSSFTMTTTSARDSSLSETNTFTAAVDQCYGLELKTNNILVSSNPGDASVFPLTLTNLGNGDDTFSLMTMGASEWTPTLSSPNVTLAMGASSSDLTFALTAPSDSSANAMSGDSMVHAYSESCGDDLTGCTHQEALTLKAKANQVFSLTAGYYNNGTADVSSYSVEEGGTLIAQVNITNTGNGQDEVTFTLDSAPSWIIFDSDKALLAPTKSAAVMVSLNAPSDGQGTYSFKVIATSADGSTTATTGTITVTVTEKGGATGPTTETTDEDDGGLPGFSALSAIAAIGAVLLLRRRL